MGQFVLSRILLSAGILGATAVSAEEPADLPQVLVTSSRLSEGTVVGSSTTTVTAADLAGDPAADLPSILARQAGIQLQALYGGVNGAQSVIGLRGFGATANENTLVLVNGRRVNDPDQSNLDFSAIPMASIERIEITRGNAAAVLYGDGAVGGVINIVTKNGDNAEPGITVAGALGSFQYRDAQISTNRKIGDTSLSFYATDTNSHGYRINNALREKNGDAEIRQRLGDGEFYLNIRGDDQYLGFPGAISPSAWRADPKAAGTVHDYGDLQSLNVTLGVTWNLAEGIELVADAGLRRKEEQAVYRFFGSFYGIALTTASLTPRLSIDREIFGIRSQIVTGVDLYQSFYKSWSALDQRDAPNDDHRLDQRMAAVYAEDSMSLSPSTSLGLGVRLQQADIRARERVYFGGVAGTPLDQTDSEYAAHLGIEQKILPGFGVFARISHAMRMPNMDDRNFVTAYPTDFRLRTQISNDAEIGATYHFGPVTGQASVYAMNLHNEIDFDPGANFGIGANVNLDPTRRIGAENELRVMVTKDLELSGAVTWTDATFRDGPYKGANVPQVARVSGDLGIDWTILGDWLYADGHARWIGKRKLGDDVLGLYPAIPGYATIDLKIGGKVETVAWSISALNLLDTHHYDLGYANSFTGVSIYPLPGRDVIGRIGVSF